MTEKSKPGAPAGGAVEAWNRAVREAYVEDAPTAAEPTDEEIERQLRAAGVDLEAEDAEADATYDAMVRKLAPTEAPAVVETRDDENEGLREVGWVHEAPVTRVAGHRRTSRSVWIAYAVAAAAATGGAAYVAGRSAPPPPPPPPVHEEPVVRPPPPVPVPTVAPPVERAAPVEKALPPGKAPPDRKGPK